jgi:hypothetical protein
MYSSRAGEHRVRARSSQRDWRCLHISSTYEHADPADADGLTCGASANAHTRANREPYDSSNCHPDSDRYSDADVDAPSNDGRQTSVDPKHFPGMHCK